MPRSTSSTTSEHRFLPPGAPRPLLAVGRVLRAHGLRGEVVVELTSNRPERLARGAKLVAAGRLLTVARAAPHGRRHKVAFAEVADRASAEALAGTELKAQALREEGTLWAHELVGAAVVTTAGDPAGSVTALEANPASDLLVTDSGHLVPLAFVVGVEERDAQRVVVVEVPEGLLG